MTLPRKHSFLKTQDVWKNTVSVGNTVSFGAQTTNTKTQQTVEASAASMLGYEDLKQKVG